MCNNRWPGAALCVSPSGARRLSAVSRCIQTSLNMSKKLLWPQERLQIHSNVMARQPAAGLPGPG